jgi:hypothetical protein
MGAAVMTKLRWQRYAPKLIVTREMLEAFVNEEHMNLHVAIGWKPWEYSPLDPDLPEPRPDQPPTGNLRQRSLWRALALREQLQHLAEREGIKPAHRAAQVAEVR